MLYPGDSTAIRNTQPPPGQPTAAGTRTDAQDRVFPGGTTYGLAVDAADAAGNRSAKASINGTTRAGAPPPGWATIQPGQSWKTAHTSVPVGSVPNVAAGSEWRAATSGSKAVTLLGQNGAVLALTMERCVEHHTRQCLHRRESAPRSRSSSSTARTTCIATSKIRCQHRCPDGRQPPLVRDLRGRVLHHRGDDVGGRAGRCSYGVCLVERPDFVFRCTTFRDCAAMDLFLTRGDWHGEANARRITVVYNNVHLLQRNQQRRRPLLQPAGAYVRRLHRPLLVQAEPLRPGRRLRVAIRSSTPSSAGNTAQVENPSWSAACTSTECWYSFFTARKARGPP